MKNTSILIQVFYEFIPDNFAEIYYTKKKKLRRTIGVPIILIDNTVLHLSLTIHFMQSIYDSILRIKNSAF